MGHFRYGSDELFLAPDLPARLEAKARHRAATPHPVREVFLVLVWTEVAKEGHMNIILIIIDTLRYDYVGANGNGRIQTPNMDRLAGESRCFDRAFCSSFPTIPHRTDVMTGQYGRPFNPWKPLAFDAPALPWLLAGAGYATQLIHDTPHLVNGGHNFDWPFHAWTFVRGADFLWELIVVG